MTWERDINCWLDLVKESVIEREGIWSKIKHRDEMRKNVKMKLRYERQITMLWCNFSE